MIIPRESVLIFVDSFTENSIKMLSYSLTPVRYRPFWLDRKALLCLLLGFIFPNLSLMAQNLVDNPSFETNTNIPVVGGQMFLAPPWNEAFPTITTPDYFHSASTGLSVALPNTFIGQVNPYHGQAVAGMYTFITNGYREYIRTKLNTPMQVGQMYRLTFSITKGDQSSALAANACDGFGALLSTYPPYQQQYGPFYINNIPVAPQWEMTQMFSSSLWVTFQVDLWADSTYEYLTFGNFKDNANTNVDPASAFSVEYLFIDSVALTPVLELSGPAKACIGDTLSYGAYPPGGAYSWTVNGIPAGSGDSLSFVMTDTVEVELIGPGASRTRTVVFPPDPAPDLGPDLLLCDGDLATLSIIPGHDWTVTWPNGSQGLQFQTADSGWVQVQVDSLGCPGLDSIYIETQNSPQIDLGPDTMLCDGELLTLSIPRGTSHAWSTSGTDTVAVISSPGFVWAEMTNGCGTDRDSVELTYLSPPFLMLPADTSLCETDSLFVNIVPDPSWMIVWDDQQTTWSRWTLPGNTYGATVTNQCGSDFAVLFLDEILIPQLALGPDQDLCEGEEIILSPVANISSIVWNDGSTALQRTISTPGTFSATLANECGIAEDQLTVTEVPFPRVDLGPDTSICEGEVLLLTVPQQGVDIRWNNGDTGPIFLVSESGRVEVEVSNICGRVEDSRTITVDLPLSFSLPADTQICDGDQLVLHRPQDVVGFSWPDGSIDETFRIEFAGRYIAQAVNACGTVIDEILVETYDCSCQLFVPSAFSPNDDGENDVFYLGTVCETEDFVFSIYDRWGRLVAEFSEPGFGWDGQNAPEGVYLWKAESSWVGRSGSALQRTQSGTVTLIR